jgi:hypothetical protein
MVKLQINEEIAVIKKCGGDDVEREVNSQRDVLSHFLLCDVAPSTQYSNCAKKLIRVKNLNLKVALCQLTSGCVRSIQDLQR